MIGGDSSGNRRWGTGSRVPSTGVPERGKGGPSLRSSGTVPEKAGSLRGMTDQKGKYKNYADAGASREIHHKTWPKIFHLDALLISRGTYLWLEETRRS